MKVSHPLSLLVYRTALPEHISKALRNPRSTLLCLYKEAMRNLGLEFKSGRLQVVCVCVRGRGGQQHPTP